MAEAPKVTRSPRIPLVWVVPIVAAAVAGWLLFREWRTRGEEITVEFADGTGLEPGQTKVQYKGVEIGTLKQVSLSKDLHDVVAHLQLTRRTSMIARQGTQFWIVQPEIGFSGVSGLDTLLSGVHIGVRPGDGPPVKDFRGLDAPPAPENTEEGRAFLLETDRLGGLQVRAPVFYRDLKVGEVEAARLSPDASGVLIRVRIDKVYVPLVRTNTHFWNAGGAPFQISLFGGGTQKKSLQSVITGAIAFATPDTPGENAADGARFLLYKDADDDWLKWRPSIPIQAPDTSPAKPSPSKVVPGLLGGGG
ncbi:MAG TPA: MlaD family protein [Candidatus Didemnitutus sp.]|nr:MlaD family protein [Candidatus Didemnitutus sp.]